MKKKVGKGHKRRTTIGEEEEGSWGVKMGWKGEVNEKKMRENEGRGSAGSENAE